MTMSVPIALFLGILIGWIIEFALDKLFWQRSNKTAKQAADLNQKAITLEKERADLWMRLTESEQNKGIVTEQLDISKTKLAEADVQAEEMKSKIADLEAQVKSFSGKTTMDETTTKVIRAAKKRILSLEAQVKQLKQAQTAVIDGKTKLTAKQPVRTN